MIAVLSGGVGAARFLARAGRTSSTRPTSPRIVNTGDDTMLHGLSISPDLDTVTYTLAGAIDPERAGGSPARRGGRWRRWQRYDAGPPDGSAAARPWFNLGDRDLATHLYRTARLAEGASLTDVTAEICRGLGRAQRDRADERRPRRRPSSRSPDGGEVSFQEYFVQRHHASPSTPSASTARRGPADARRSTTPCERPTCVVIAPSNPIVSIGPIRALRRRRRACSAPDGIASSRCRRSSAARR